MHIFSGEVVRYKVVRNVRAFPRFHTAMLMRLGEKPLEKDKREKYY